MPSVVQYPRRRRPVQRWTGRLAIWLVVLGAMSVGTCRRRDERVVARAPASRGPGGPVARPSAPMVPTVVGAGPAVRHSIMPHVVGVQPRASRRSGRRLARLVRMSRRT